MGGRLWKDEDVQFLRGNLNRGLPFVAKALNRTETAVHQKAWSLGLDVRRDQMSARTYTKELERFKRSGRNRYAERKEEGLCTRCGKRWAEAGQTKCRPCRERDQKWSRDNSIREYLREYKRLQKAERREKNLCINCGQPLEPQEIGTNTNCTKCRKKNMERTTVKRIQMRIHGIKRKR